MHGSVKEDRSSAGGSFSACSFIPPRADERKVKEQVPSEESCRAGACSRRLILQSFALRGEVLSQRWESTQRIAGGRLRMSAPRSYSPYPRSPITGVTPWAGQIIFGAQNLSGFPRFLPAHWGLVFPKLNPVRFHCCAWVCRANGTRSVDGGSPKGLPYPKQGPPLENCRGGACPSRRISEIFRHRRAGQCPAPTKNPGCFFS